MAPQPASTTTATDLDPHAEELSMLDFPRSLELPGGGALVVWSTFNLGIYDNALRISGLHMISEHSLGCPDHLSRSYV